MLLWFHSEVVSSQFRWRGHGGESNDEIISHRYFMRDWFRSHGAIKEAKSQIVVGGFFEWLALAEARASRLWYVPIINTDLFK